MDFNCLIRDDEPDDYEEPIFDTANIDESEEKISRNISTIPVVRGRAKTYPCPECTGTFRIKKDYLIHYSKVHHSRSVPFKCEECPKSFSKSGHLKTHKTRAHPKCTENMFFKCSKCPTAFNREEDLDRHLVNVHRVDRKITYHCPNCPKVFHKKSNFQMHLPSHSADRPYFCYICPDACFKFKSSLARHVRIAHKMELHDVQPDYESSKNTAPANSVFYDNDITCEEIVIKNDSVPMQIYQCDKCPKIYRHEGNLARHLASEHKPFEHTKEKVGFDCDKCNTFFAKEQSYKHHLTYYHNENGGLKYRLFHCSVCDLKFCTRKSFQVHMSDIHKLRKYMIQCEVCSKTFASKHGWRCHMARVHQVADGTEKDG